MAHNALVPVFVGLRMALHMVFVGLTLLVVGRAVFVATTLSPVVVVMAIILTATYATGGFVARSSKTHGRVLGLLWLTLVTGEWVVLLGFSPMAAYLVFPLFFLYLHLLGRRLGSLMVVITTGIAIVAIGLEVGWSAGGVVGPLIGAAVAVMIGLGYQALADEAADRERLMTELVATRGQLAATEHESGVLAERARLAREIHDTVAQGLSSIQMLLHAAERADSERPGLEHIRLARETAAANLADTRRFIRELTPPNLVEVGLGGTLRRLAAAQWAPQGLTVSVRIPDSLVLPMHLQTALLRIAQGSIANVLQHARASTATILLSLECGDLSFTITDDGRGFNPEKLASNVSVSTTDSFGLKATRERVDQLGGALTIESAPGRGTTVTIKLAVEATA